MSLPLLGAGSSAPGGSALDGALLWQPGTDAMLWQPGTDVLLWSPV